MKAWDRGLTRLRNGFTAINNFSHQKIADDLGWAPVDLI